MGESKGADVIDYQALEEAWDIDDADLFSAESVDSADEPAADEVSITPVSGDLSWQKDGNCVQTDGEAFFPEKETMIRRIAKKVCDNCDVRVQCLNYALDNDERFGIWGGLSERERRRLQLEQNSNAGNDETPELTDDALEQSVEIEEKPEDLTLVQELALLDPTSPEFMECLEKVLNWGKSDILTSEQKLDMFLRYEAGDSLPNIARELGLAKWHVYSVVSGTQQRCTPEVRAILFGPEESEE